MKPLINEKCSCTCNTEHCCKGGGEGELNKTTLHPLTILIAHSGEYTLNVAQVVNYLYGCFEITCHKHRTLRWASFLNSKV